ncbi:MAG: AbrB family transcriptional regulator [Aquificota bacterium]|nr:MAG: AbrB family transcriptional regulator [Aquificota bacterium]
MKTVVTSKFQTTIPKKVREELGISVHDALEWEVRGGEIVVRPVSSRFLSFKGAVKVGPGDIERDIEEARRAWVGEG